MPTAGAAEFTLRVHGPPFTMMLAEFCTRLACGLSLMLLVTSCRDVAASYFRAVTQIVLGVVLAGMLGLLMANGELGVSGTLLAGAAAAAIVGSIVWTLGRVQAGRWITALLAATTAATLMIGANAATTPDRDEPSGVISPVHARLLASLSSASSATLLGAMTAAMLLGHSYLVSPTMPIDPLQRLVAFAAGAVGLRVIAAADGAIAFMNGIHANVPDSLGAFWWTLLVSRWVIGLVGCGLIVALAWRTARIRSTQSATGILYVGVIFAFFGELTGQLLAGRSGIGL